MKTTKQKRNWQVEQAAFLSALAPEWHFHRAFDGLPDIYFFAKNKRGETLFCSSNLPVNHGLQNVAAMIGKTDHDLTPGPLAVKYLSDDAEIYRTGLPLPPTIEICIDQVGLPAWYRTCKYPLKDRDDRVIGIMGTFQRVTDLKSLPVYAGAIATVQSVLEDNLGEFPSIEALAKLVGMTTRSFQRQFQKLYRMSPRTYWMKLRIRKACEYISSGQLGLSAIAMELGFFDQSNFSKHFRFHAGMTPKSFSQRYSNHG